MKFTSKGFKNSLLISLVGSLFLFTGCSQKSSQADYGKFYKDTKNPKIKNSKQMHKYTMRPYSVFGIKYYPFVANIGDEFTGIASWYGPDFHSKKTSNGEIYDMYDMTAAHKTLPMNTIVRVKNLENSKTIIVRINDRGPFVKGRIIDLSNKAAHEIDMVKNGTAKVKVTVLGYNAEIENANAPIIEMASSSAISKEKQEIEPLAPLEIKESNISKTITAAATETATKKSVKPIENKNNLVNEPYSLQVGAFSIEKGAIVTRDKYQNRFRNNKVDIKKTFSNGKTLNRVLIKGFSNYEEAQKFKRDNNLNSAVIRNN